MPSSDSEDILLDDPPEINPYEVLSVPTTASDDDIKKAYRKLALKHHPDKGGSHTSFQTLAFAYSILSTPSRRSLYDATGSLQPPDPLSSPDGFNWRDFYREQHKDIISDASIAAFRAEYKGSEEEKDDLLAVFEKNKGDMKKVYEEVMLSDPLEDEERFRGIIDAAIEAGVVEGWGKYVKETKRQRERRIKTAGREEGEARELAQELGIGKGKGGEEALKALIVKRSQDSQQGFLERLEAKYGAKPAAGKKGKAKAKGKKRPPPSDEDDEDDEAEEGGYSQAPDEPPEAAFQAMAARAAKKQKESTTRPPPRTAAIGAGGRAPRKGRPKA